MRKEIVIEGGHITSLTDFHESLAKALSFPNYYRHDVDDLYDNLCYYIDPNITIFWNSHRDSQNFLKNEFDRIIEVFERVKSIHSEFEYYLN